MVSQPWLAHTNDAISLKKMSYANSAEGVAAPQMRSISEFFNTTRVDGWQAQRAVDSSRMRFADLHCVHLPHL
jgi:hypothetical protein